MRLKTESETVGRVRLASFARVSVLPHALPISLLILRKKPTVLQSKKEPEKNINCKDHFQFHQYLYPQVA